MTPPKVDISALKIIQLGNLDGLDPKEKANLFKGTDLVYDPKTDNVDLTANPGQTNMDLERAYVESLRSANTNGDNFLDLTEAKALIDSSLPPEVAAVTDPKQFLKNVDALMKGRYSQMGKNFESLRGQLAFGPTLDALKYYNEGLLSEGYRHANAVLPANGLPTKSLTNILLSPWSLGRSIFGKKGDDSHDPANQSLVADKWAMETAKKNHEKRSEAIGKLKKVIEEGMSKNEKWAIDVNLDEALKKLDEGDRKLLVDQLAAKRLHEILTTEDPKKRFEEMKKFADKERPGFGGFGTGNTSAGWLNTDDLWNISGHRHNTVFARTMYQYLATKSNTGDAEHDQVLHRETKLALSDSQGDTGGFNNLASIGFTGVGCSAAWLFTSPSKLWRDANKPVVNMSTCVTDYRDWSDEDIIDAPGRTLDGAIMVFGANALWNRGGQFRKLRALTSENRLGIIAEAKAEGEKLTLFDRMRAYGQGYYNNGGKGALQVWWQGLKTTRPTPFKVFNVFGNEAKYATAIGEAEALAGGKQVETLFEKVINRMVKGLPKLSDEQKAALAKNVSGAGKKGFDVTKTICVIGIAAYADGKMNPPFDAFPINRESDFKRYPDPTKPPIVGGK